jgi:hypothetical protein
VTGNAVAEGTSTTRDLSASKGRKGKSGTKESQKAYYTPVGMQKPTRCFSERDAVSSDTVEQGCVKEKKRSGDRVTWANTCTFQDTVSEEHGGIAYKGDHYDGVKISKTTTGNTTITRTIKISGRRTGDGDCLAQRDYTSKRQGTGKERANQVR